MPKLLRLREHRERKALSQRELATSAQTTQMTIARIESGLHEARPTTTRKLAKALGVRPADLLGQAQREVTP